MKSVVQYLGDTCKQCIKCVKLCPTDAISIINEKVIFDQQKCIHCHICNQVCEKKVIKIENVNLDDAFRKHEYNIALIPTAILSDLNQYDEIKNIASAIKKFGFDEVVEYSDIEGALYHQAFNDIENADKVMLTSFCPTINRLIEHEYPTLMEHLLPYEYPVEIAAKRLREKYKDKDIGIFSFCECVGKLMLAKEPFDNQDSQIDFALSISRMFPHFNKRKTEQQESIDINKYGVKSIVGDLFRNRQSAISVEGLPQIRAVLDLIEFDQLKHVKLIALYHCYEGCIGGYYLWSNPFEGRVHIDSMLEQCKTDILTLNKDEYFKEHAVQVKQESVKERLEWFNKVNAILETLPQYDCGSCGFANCRDLADKIARGEVKDSLCRVKKGNDMKINEILKLSLKQINDVSLHTTIESVYIGDLLSFVMGYAKENTLWLTVQKNLNVIAIAELNDFAGVIFLQDSYPDEEVIKKATDLEIPLFVTSLHAYEMAKELMTLGL